MKKAKIMLMSIAVLATVGSALAFKVNKLGVTTYCYLETTVQPSLGECTEEVTNKTALPSGPKFYYYTHKTKPNCTELECPTTAKDFGI